MLFVAFFQHSQFQYLLEYHNKYGYKDWYDWSVANWGTKWDACNSRIINNDEIYFDTAWNEAEPIHKKLSEKYPKETIICECIYEDGLPKHTTIWKNGECIEDYWENANEYMDEEEYKEAFCID